MYLVIGTYMHMYLPFINTYLKIFINLSKGGKELYIIKIFSKSMDTIIFTEYIIFTSILLNSFYMQTFFFF